MYCKYCGQKIEDDSVFCVKCGQKVQHDMSKDNLAENRPIRVQIVESKISDWRDTTNMQWKKPITAIILQSIFAVVGLFFLVYGIVWISIIKGNLWESYSVSGCYITAEDFFGIVSVQSPLDYSYESTGYSYGYPHAVYSDSGLVIHNYNVVKQKVVMKFRIYVLLIFILPALVIIAFTSLWIIKITPKKENKSILPRDFADKMENYTWNGFSTHKYLRFITNDNKYGILDAVSRSVVIPASFDSIEWREKNKSYDGVVDGITKTYNLKDRSTL
jgi:hypothetical protein